MTEKRDSILHPMREFKNDCKYKADVIFVHGLGGDYKSTWSSKNEPEYYFPELLQEDLPDMRVWSLDYPAQKINWNKQSGDMSLYDRAINIVDYLIAEKIGEFPIIFISHSLGGLLVKKMLRISSDISNRSINGKKIKRILEQTRGVCFIATPHRGSNLANIAQYINKFFQGIPRFSELVKELKANAPELRELDFWYRNIIGNLGIETCAFRGSIKTSGFWVVDKSSSDPDVEGCILDPIDADHETICKPTKGKNSQIYIKVKSFVKRSLDTSPNESGHLYDDVINYLKRLNKQIDLQFPSPEVDFNITCTLINQPDLMLNFESFFKSLNDNKKTVLIGAAGGGKSYILRKIAKYLIDLNKPPIFINLKNWNAEKNNASLNELKKSDSKNENTKRKFDVLLRSALGNLDIAFVDSHKGVFNFILIDGLNEISNNEIIDEIIYTLDEYVRTCSKESCVIVTTRDNRRLKYVKDWAVITVNQISEDEVKKQIEKKHDFSKYKKLSPNSKAILQVPFFLDMAIKHHIIELGSAATAIESFFKSHLKTANDKMLDELAEIAFELYQKKGVLSFEMEDFEETKRKVFFEELKSSGIIFEIENGYTFNHQLLHDYLVSRHISQKQQLWKDYFFDIASFYSKSFDTISMTLEQINNVSRGDTFLKRVYNWNWVATMYCFINNLKVKEKLFSDDIKVAIKSIIAEKLFDSIFSTQKVAKEMLSSFPENDKPDFRNIENLKGIFDFIETFNFRESWFKNWKSIFLKTPQENKSDVLEENDIEEIKSKDSVIGWTVSNVIRRFSLNEAEQRQLRAIFNCLKNSEEFTDKSVKWRIVHALGKSPSEENKKLFSGILKAKNEYHWVKYGASRSLVEIAAITNNLDFRKEIFDDLKDMINNIKSMPLTVIEEIAKSVFYRGIRGEWASFVTPLLECILNRYKNTREEQIFSGKFSEFEKFIQENKVDEQHR